MSDAMGASAGPSLTVVLSSQRSEIARLAHLVDEFGTAHGLPTNVLFKVNLALDEVVTNVMRHAYSGALEREIHVTLTLSGGSLIVRVEDEGRPFDPLQSPPPDIDASIEHRPVGGLGIHLVRSVMDTVEYRRENDRNVLLMRAAMRKA